MALFLNDPQLLFLELPQKYRAFVAGYGSGKTTIGCASQCIHYYAKPGVNQGYFAPTYPQIRDIFYPSIEEVAFEFDLPVDIKEGNKEVHFGRGRFYRGTTLCRSMERPGTIIGFKIGRGFVDEIDTLPKDKAYTAWRKILGRLRWADCKNGIDVATTPEGFLFTYETFYSNPNKKPDLKNNYGIIQASTYENQDNLPTGYIESLVESYPAELIEAYINGQFVNLKTGTVYTAFDAEIHASKENIKEKEPLHIGMDFNVGKMAAKIFIIRANGWHCVDELYDVFDTPAIIDIIHERFYNHQIYVYPDASGDSRKTNNASISDIALLEQAGFSVRANPTNPRVKNRVMSVNKQFQKGELFVHPTKCKRTVEDLQQQAYDSNGEPDKKSGFDHGNDAFGYPIAYTFPIVKPAIDIPITFAT